LSFASLSWSRITAIANLQLTGKFLSSSTSVQVCLYNTALW